MMERFARRAFTVVELLVVVVIIVLLLGLAVPATQSIIESSTRSRGFNAMDNSLRSARDAAVRSPAGDTAAVFFYDKDLGTVVQTCQRVGSLIDLDSNGRQITRDVFVPLGIYEPIVVPDPWSIRGYAPAGSMNDDWYGGGTLYNDNAASRGQWVFPLAHTYDPTDYTSGDRRATFMVRFRARTGELVRSAEPAIVVSPSPASGDRGFGTSSPFQITRASDLRGWATNVLSNPSPALSNNNGAGRRSLIGAQSADTVLAAPVSELTLYDERELAAALGLRGTNRVYGSIYTLSGNEPEIDGDLALAGGVASGLSDSDTSLLITEWVQATAGVSADSVVAEPIRSSARIFFVNPYSGKLVEIEP